LVRGAILERTIRQKLPFRKVKLRDKENSPNIIVFFQREARRKTLGEEMSRSGVRINQGKRQTEQKRIQDQDENSI